MKRTLLFLTAGFFLCIGLSVRGNGQSFNVQDYKAFLSAHKNMTGQQVLEEYPSPLLKKSAAPVSQVSYLDSVILKLKLTKDEQSLLMSNGFVVSERLQQPTFQEAFYDIWKKDLPVIVTTDAILHALHLSYDKILQTTELQMLAPKLKTLLENLHTKALPALKARYTDSRMLQSLQDVDVYLTIARRLLLSGSVKAYLPESEKSVTELMALIKGEQPADYKLFSTTNRTVDFSQFTIRGHYTQSAELGRYFQSMIWLGRTEFMLTKPVQQGVAEQTDEDIQRQIIDAYVLAEALDMNSSLALLKGIDGMIKFLVGESDNVNSDHLAMLKQETGFSAADQLLDMNLVTAFKTNLATKPFAEQRINSQILMSDPGDPEQLKPSSAFLLLGQRFIIDSYVLGNVVYDKILKDGAKVLRMLPTPLDALFALGNDAAGQLIQDQLAQYFYAPNLTGLRYLIDSYEDDFWNASLYNAWLNSIRALNMQKNVEPLPEFMQTAAWWQQKMNTQLASWAQLRHDNLLYGKQSYSGGTTCSYPEGYVEPYPEFYKRIGMFARKAETTYSQTPEVAFVAPYFRKMAVVMDTLQLIATDELASRPLTPQQKTFIQSIMFAGGICGIVYDGWYVRLLYGEQSDSADLVIADVHTAPTDEAGNPIGWVLHAGTGNVNLGVVIAPSQNGGSTAYVGPMLSYYEHVTTNFKRLTDEEWKSMITNGSYPRPAWVNNYLADATGTKRAAGPSLATITTGVEPNLQATVTSPVLYQNYPNPVSSGTSTLISFTLPAGNAATTTLEIFDVNGRKVRTLLNQTIPSATYVTRWDGRNDAGSSVPSGVYVYQLTNGVMSVSQQLTVVK